MFHYRRILPNIKSRKNIPASYGSMKVDNELFFLGSKTIMLEVRSQIVGPSEPAAFTTPIQPCKQVKKRE